MPKKVLDELRPCACGCGELVRPRFNYQTGQYTHYKQGHWQRDIRQDTRHKETPWRNKDWLYHQYVELEKPQRQIATEMGCHQTTILHWMQKYGISVRSKSWYRGDKHPRYRGGTIDGHGYHVFTDTDGKRKRAHRAVMEKVLGRKLNPDEIVHHINSDRLDNRESNLEVMSRAEHDLLSLADALVTLAQRFPHRIPEIKAKIDNL